MSTATTVVPRATALTAGAEAPQRTYGPITRSDLVRYAGAGGDFNPIHHDETFARDAGLESVFSMGMFHAGLLSSLVGGWLGVENVRRFALRFTGQVWPDDVLTLSGVVDGIEEHDGARLATCSFTVARQTGDVVITATATAIAS